MSDQIISVIKNKNKDAYIAEVTKFDKKNTIATKAEVASGLLMKTLVYVDAIKIQGDVIYKQALENDALREQLGDLNEEEVKNRVNWHETNDTDEVKNARIYNKLMDEINSSTKMIQKK